jgi:hypothetical protein
MKLKIYKTKSHIKKKRRWKLRVYIDIIRDLIEINNEIKPNWPNLIQLEDQGSLCKINKMTTFLAPLFIFFFISPIGELAGDPFF